MLQIRARASSRTAAAFTAGRLLLRPPPELTVSQWAEQFRYLSRKDSARPGRWRSEPHQIKIMDAFSDPIVRKVVVKAASQFVGKSQMMNNVIGYVVDQNPSNMMVVHPTIAAAEKWAKGRLDPLIAETPCLKGKFLPRKNRDSDSTILHRQIRGGQMFIGSAGNPIDLSAQSVRDLFIDEIDRFEPSAGDEGDPVELAEARTVDYGEFAKIGLFSTPLLEGSSRIDAAYQESDRQDWHIRCPHCEDLFAPLWQHVVWDKTADGKALPDTAALVCPQCGVPWTEGDRLRAIEAGDFIAEAPFDGIRGFHVNALGCRRASLPKLVRRWEKAQGNAHRLKAFVNLVLAETWKVQGEAPEWQRLYDRREDWPANVVPAGVVFLTIGVDTQGDRLEARVWGWGRDKQRWHIETRVIPGNLHSNDPWAELDAFIGQTWQHASGAYLRAARVAIDSAGHHTRQVYAWVKRQSPQQVMAVIGNNRGAGFLVRAPKSAEVGNAGKTLKTGLKPWNLNPDPLKGQLYGFLRLEKPTDEALASGGVYPPGYVHLSKRADEEEIRQLTAEQLVTTRTRNGFGRREWQKTRDRNEALDCAVYAHAAAIASGLDRFTPARWDELEAGLRAEAAAAVPGTPVGAMPQAMPQVTQPGAPARPQPGFNPFTGKARGGWLGRR